VTGRGASPSRRLPPSFAELIDPLLRMKLELAGYTLADAETLQLTTSERTESTTTVRRGSAVTETTKVSRGTTRTLADVPATEQNAIAHAVGLQGVLAPTLSIRTTSSGRLSFALTLELRRLTDGALALRVRCAELFEFPEETSSVLANCVGDGVLAQRAPDALWGRSP
jgi:hypothetical protein